MTLWVKWCFGHCLSISILRWGWRWLPGPAMVGRLLCWVVCSHRFILLYRSQTFCLHQSQRFYVSPYARSENNIEVFLCVRLHVSSVAEQNPLSCFFSRSVLSFSRICQGPLGRGRGRGQEQHPNLPTCAAYRLCLGGGGAGSPSSPSYHGTGDILQASSYSGEKNAWGKHLLSQKFSMTVSFAAGLFFHPSPHKEVNKCLLFFLFPYGLFTGFCLCAYECSLALTAVRELFY